MSGVKVQGMKCVWCVWYMSCTKESELIMVPKDERKNPQLHFSTNLRRILVKG